MIAPRDFPSSVTDIQGAFFKEVSLSALWKETGFNSSVMKEKELRRSQVMSSSSGTQWGFLQRRNETLSLVVLL